MTIHHFTLIVDGPDLQDDTVIDAVFEAGCGDAAIGRIDGIQYVDFDREAPSLDEAILSAVANLERIDGVDVVRIADAGLVSMADIAVRIRRTREGVRLLITGARGPGGFPPPVTDPRSRYRLWRWSDVAHWCMNHLGEDLADQGDEVLTAIALVGVEAEDDQPRLDVDLQRCRVVGDALEHLVAFRVPFVEPPQALEVAEDPVVAVDYLVAPVAK